MHSALYAQSGDSLQHTQKDTVDYGQDISSNVDSLPLSDKTITGADTLPAAKSYGYTVPLDPKYGNLLNDDPAYNPKSPWWKPAGRVLISDVTNWAMDRYL